MPLQSILVWPAMIRRLLSPVVDAEADVPADALTAALESPAARATLLTL